MAQRNDSKNTVVNPSGGQITDGGLTFFLSNGATSPDLQSATQEFLIARGATTGDLNDMWLQFLSNIVSLPMSGHLAGMKSNWWANGAPLI